MKIKLNFDTNLMKNGATIFEVIKELEEHIGPEIKHERQTTKNFFMGRGWAIDLCGNDWVVRMDARQAKKPWILLFLLRWS